MLNSNYIADNEVDWFTASIYDENDNFLGNSKNHIIDSPTSWTICKKINTFNFHPNTQTYDSGYRGYASDCGLCVRSYHARNRREEAEELREEKRLAKIQAERDAERAHMQGLVTPPAEAAKAVAGSMVESDGFELGAIEATAEVMDALEELGVIQQPSERYMTNEAVEAWMHNFCAELD